MKNHQKISEEALEKTQNPQQKASAKDATGNQKDAAPLNEGPSAEHLSLLACILRNSSTVAISHAPVRAAMNIWKEAKQAAANPEHYMSRPEVGIIKFRADGKPEDTECYFKILGDIPFRELVSRGAVQDSRKGGPIKSVQGIQKAVKRFYQSLQAEADASANTQKVASKTSSSNETNLAEEFANSSKTKTLLYERWIELVECQNKELSRRPNNKTPQWRSTLTPEQQQRLDELSTEPHAALATAYFPRTLAL